MVRRHEWIPTDLGRAAICINCELVISADILTQALYPPICTFQECRDSNPHRLDLTNKVITCRHCDITVAELLKRLRKRPTVSQGRKHR